MSKITKKQLHNGWYCHDTEIIKMKKELRELKQSVLRLEKLTDEKLLDEPQLKQLDQSAFDHPYVTDRFKYVALNADGQAVFFESKPVISNFLNIWVVHTGSILPMLKGYDATNWQNSLIERKELTGSDYYHSGIASKLLERGQKLVVCFVSNLSEADAFNKKDIEVITSVDTEFNDADDYGWQFVVPINNQGEPLTASEVGL